MIERELEAVIFDMDGVLVDSEPHHYVIEQGLFDELGLSISREEHLPFMGMAADEMWSALIERYDLDYSTEELLDRNNSAIVKYFSDLDDFQAMPGVEDLLLELKRQKIPVAVASSSSAPVVDHLLEESGLSDYFEIRVSGQMVEQSKPEPYIYLYTAELLGVVPEHCLVIEDSTNGVKSAKAAGMYCVGYQGVGFKDQDQSMADMTITHFDELTEKFARMDS